MDGEFPLPIDRTTKINLWSARNRVNCVATIEFDDFLVSQLESYSESPY